MKEPKNCVAISQLQEKKRNQRWYQTKIKESNQMVLDIFEIVNSRTTRN